MLSHRDPQHRDPQVQAEWRENANTIRRIPYRELPCGPARDALIALALRGHDVRAYVPVASDHHVIWIRPEHPWQEGRMTAAEWIERYHATGAAAGQEGGATC